MAQKLKRTIGIAGRLARILIFLTYFAIFASSSAFVVVLIETIFHPWQMGILTEYGGNNAYAELPIVARGLIGLTLLAIAMESMVWLIWMCISYVVARDAGTANLRYSPFQAVAGALLSPVYMWIPLHIMIELDATGLSAEEQERKNPSQIIGFFWLGRFFLLPWI